MAAEQPGSTGATHGSDERPARQVAGAALAFDLAKEGEQLRQEVGRQQRGHDAKTLVKEQGLRLVLLSLQSGATLDEHQAPGPVAIHVLSGEVQVLRADQTVPLQGGQVLVLEASVRHAVAALKDSEVLLTLAGATYGGPTPESGADAGT